MQRGSTRRGLLGMLAGLLTVLLALIVGASAASAEAAQPAKHAHLATSTGATAKGRATAVGKAAAPGQQNKAAQGVGAVLEDVITTTGTLTRQRGSQAASGLGTTASQVVNRAGKTVTNIATSVTGATSTGKTDNGKAKGENNGKAKGQANGNAFGKVKNGSTASRAGAIQRLVPAGSLTAPHSATSGTRTAPLDGPTLVAGHASHQPTARTVPGLPEVAALTPTTLLTAPGTGVLVGVLFGLALGVCAMVYGAGRRRSRAR